MRKQKTIKIDDREITIKELRVKDIIELIDNIGGEGIVDFQKNISDYLPRITEDIRLDDLLGMAPSEIALLYDAFKEVNTHFFEIARSLGLEVLIAKMKEAIFTDFSELFVGSLKPATGKSMDTGTPSSSSH